MTRILIAGYQHETNTFAPSLADWAAFQSGEAFPAYVRGQAMRDQMSGVNIHQNHGMSTDHVVVSRALPSARRSTTRLYDPNGPLCCVKVAQSTEPSSSECSTTTSA